MSCWGGALHFRSVELAAAGSLALAAAVGGARGLAAGRRAAPTGPVLTTPVTSIPHFPATTTTVEQIRQIAKCGQTMYAVGTFSTIKRQSTVYQRNNIFSFSATAPYQVTTWDPNVNGTVNSI